MGADAAPAKSPDDEEQADKGEMSGADASDGEKPPRAADQLAEDGVGAKTKVSEAEPGMAEMPSPSGSTKPSIETFTPRSLTRGNAEP